MPDEELSAIYAEVNRRGLFKKDADLQAIGHELRRRKLISDPTQGGLVTPAPAQPAQATQTTQPGIVGIGSGMGRGYAGVPQNAAPAPQKSTLPPVKTFRSKADSQKMIREQTLALAADPAVNRPDLTYGAGQSVSVTGKSKLKSTSAITAPKQTTVGQKAVQLIGKAGEIAAAPMRKVDEMAARAVLESGGGTAEAQSRYRGAMAKNPMSREYLANTPIFNALAPHEMEALDRDPSLEAGYLRFMRNILSPGNAIPLGGILKGSQTASRMLAAAFGAPAVVQGTEGMLQAQNPGQVLENALNMAVGGMALGHAATKPRLPVETVNRAIAPTAESVLNKRLPKPGKLTAEQLKQSEAASMAQANQQAQMGRSDSTMPVQPTKTMSAAKPLPTAEVTPLLAEIQRRNAARDAAAQPLQPEPVATTVDNTAKLKQLKTRRKELTELYGAGGNAHPSNNKIGGLNPASQELKSVREQIRAIEESAKSAPEYTLSPKVKGVTERSPKGEGLLFDVVKDREIVGQIGRDNRGEFYTVQGDNVQNFKTIKEAKQAFSQSIQPKPVAPMPDLVVKPAPKTAQTPPMGQKTPPEAVKTAPEPVAPMPEPVPVVKPTPEPPKRSPIAKGSQLGQVTRPMPGEAPAPQAPTLTPAERLRQAKTNAALDTKINYAADGVMTRREWVDKKLSAGSRAEEKQIPDTAKINKLTKELESLKSKGEPSGNRNYPATKRYFEIQSELDANPTKSEYRIAHPDGSLHIVTKTEYDYAQQKAQPAPPPPPDWAQRLMQAEENVKAKIEASRKNPDRYKKLNAAVDPEDFALLAEWGAIKLARKGMDFATFAKEFTAEVRKSVADDYADSLAPHLRRLYEDAQKVNLSKYGGILTPATPRQPAEDSRLPLRSAENAQTSQQGNSATPEPLTGAKNATTEAEAKQRGLAPVERQAYTTIPDAYEAGKAAVEAGTDARSLAKSVADKPRPLDAKEVGTLAYDRAQIIKEYDRATAELAKAVDAGSAARINDLQAKQERLMNDLDINTQALVKGGREQSAAFNARKLMIGQDFSYAGIQQRAKAAKAEALTPQEKAKFDGLTARLKDAETKLAQAEEALAQAKQPTPTRQNKAAQGVPKFSLNEAEKARIEAAKQRIRQKSSQIGAAPDATILADVIEVGTVYVQAGMRNLNEWRAQMRTELPGVDDDTFNEAWRSIVTNRSRETRLTGQIQQFGQKIAQGDFTLPKRREPATPTETVKQLQAQRDQLKAQIQYEINKLKPRTFGQRLADVASVPRSLITSMDLSAPLRQGSVLSLANPRLALKNVGPMLRAFTSEKAAQIVENNIRERPNAARYEESGLYLAPLNENSSLGKREEAFMSALAEKLPGVRPSERAYVTYLNKLRADSFDMFERALPNATPEELTAVADFINTATGRGKLGASGERAATLLNNIFFSPRYLTSRVQLLAGEPFYEMKGSLPSLKGSARSRALVARTYLQYAGAIFAITQLAKQGGAEVETDPRHTDFLKLKAGNTVVDILAGMQQAGTYFARMATGKKIGAGGGVSDLNNPGYKGQTRKDLSVDFLRGKLAPVPGAAVNLMEGKNIVGQPTDLKTEAGRLLIPMSWPDVYQAAKEEGMPQASAVFLMSLFGVGAQYRSKTDRPPLKSGKSSTLKGLGLGKGLGSGLKFP